MATDGPNLAVTLPQIAPDQAMVAALGDPRVPRVYGNQFFTFMGSHDVTLLFGVNTVASGVVSLSYPLAKTLGESLTKAVADYEAQIGVKVTDTAAIEAAMKSKA